MISLEKKKTTFKLYHLILLCVLGTCLSPLRNLLNDIFFRILTSGYFDSLKIEWIWMIDKI